VSEPALKIDFVGGAVGHRFRQGEGRKQPLPRAAGFAPGYTPRVVDATAGLGRAAFQLAALGAEVTLVERSPIVHGLLAQAMVEASAEGGELAETMGRMTLVHAVSQDWLAALPDGDRPDVVLVDPMHPPRAKSALVKQELRQLRDLVGADEDALVLMQAALGAARKRVVLTWPLRAAPMEGLRLASHQITTGTLRFDVFVTG
jgi:16S rRNA (guanine1516-N2)-methyltransferase